MDVKKQTIGLLDLIWPNPSTIDYYNDRWLQTRQIEYVFSVALFAFTLVTCIEFFTTAPVVDGLTIFYYVTLWIATLTEIVFIVYFFPLTKLRLAFYYINTTILSILTAFIIIFRDMLCVTNTSVPFSDPFFCAAGARPRARTAYIFITLGPLLSILILDNNIVAQGIGMMLVLIPFVITNINSEDRAGITLAVDSPLVILGYILFLYVGLVYAQRLYTTYNLYKSLREETKLRNTFTQYIMHELRNPVNALLLSLNLLEGSPQVMQCLRDTEYSTVLANMGPSINMMQSILNDTLDYQKITNGSIKMRNGPFAMSSMLRKLIGSMEPFWRSKSQTFTYTIDPRLEHPRLGFNGDELRLRQIMANYLSNAVKYTDPGGLIRMDTHIVQPFPENPPWPETVIIRFSVTDNGVGIAEADQALLFKPFVQIDNRSGSKGTGLGLSIVAAILNKMGGKYGVQSRPNQGSTFYFEAPLQTITLNSTTRLPSPGDSPTRPQASPVLRVDDDENLWRGQRMLIVDDDAITRHVLRQTLQRHAIRIEEAEDGQVGVDQFFRALSEKDPFSLIIMDDRMTPVSGQEAIRILRNAGYRVPIIALTGDTETSDKILKAGASHVLTKPTDWNQLSTVFRMLLSP